MKNQFYQRLHVLYEHHRNLALLYHLIFGKLYRPSHLRVLLRDLRGQRGPVAENLIHAAAAVG